MERLLGLQEVEATGVSRQSAREGGKVFSPTHRASLCQKISLVLTDVRVWVDPWAIMRLEWPHPESKPRHYGLKRSASARFIMPVSKTRVSRWRKTWRFLCIKVFSFVCHRNVWLRNRLFTTRCTNSWRKGSWSKAYVILPRNFSGRMAKLMRKSQDSRSAGWNLNPTLPDHDVRRGTSIWAVAVCVCITEI